MGIRKQLIYGVSVFCMSSAGAVNAAMLEEIVVTANKREQNLNDVGLAVAVLSGDDMKAQQINSLADLANTVPGLSYSNTANGTPVYTLRGIGFYEQSIGSYPSVSVYLDEVPLPFPVLTRHSAFDLERLEVLKGPQGTLFGQNATGGAINYIAAKPLDSFSAGVDLAYGRFDETNVEFFITGPLAENLNARFSGRIENADGWQTSASRSGDANGETKNYMARILLSFEPTERSRFLLNVNGSKDKSDTQAPQLIGLNFQNPLPDPDLATTSFTDNKPRNADWTPGYTDGDNQQFQVALRGDIDVTDDVTFTFISSYVDYEQDQAVDGDGVPLLSFDTQSDRGDITSFSQEIRLANDGSNTLRWVLGANYEKSEANQISDLIFPNSSSNATLGTLGYPISQSFFYSYQEFENYAVFGNVEFDVTEVVTLKAGVRYTDSEDTVQSCHGDKVGAANGTGAFFYDVLLGGALGAYVPGDCFTINNLPQAVGGVQPGSPGEYRNTLSEDNVSWTVGIDWRALDDVLVYANISEGYKAGSFPVAAPSAFISFEPVTQESVLSYEAGFKWTLFDRKLQFNGTAFYYDYEDKQLRSKVNSPPFGNLDVLQNIPESSATGIEIEIQARPIEGLTINTSLTYIDAEIDTFEGINAGGLVADFGGTDAPYTPKTQISTAIDYEFPFYNGLNAFVGASVNYRSETISIIGGDNNPPAATTQNVDLFGISDYTLVDLRAGIETADGRWTASVWGKNVFNEYYWNNSVAVFDTISRYTGRPATYGISFGYRY